MKDEYQAAAARFLAMLAEFDVAALDEPVEAEAEKLRLAAVTDFLRREVPKLAAKAP